MNLIIWLVIGGLLGWIASLFLQASSKVEFLRNVLVGIVGAVAAGTFIAPAVGVPPVTDAINIGALLISLLGGILLLGAVHLATKARHR